MNKEKINKRCLFIFIVRLFVRSFVNFPKKIHKQRLLIPTLNPGMGSGRSTWLQRRSICTEHVQTDGPYNSITP